MTSMRVEALQQPQSRISRGRRRARGAFGAGALDEGLRVGLGGAAAGGAVGPGTTNRRSSFAALNSLPLMKRTPSCVPLSVAAAVSTYFDGCSVITTNASSFARAAATISSRVPVLWPPRAEWTWRTPL